MTDPHAVPLDRSDEPTDFVPAPMFPPTFAAPPVAEWPRPEPVVTGVEPPADEVAPLTPAPKAGKTRVAAVVVVALGVAATGIFYLKGQNHPELAAQPAKEKSGEPRDSGAEKPHEGAERITPQPTATEVAEPVSDPAAAPKPDPTPRDDWAKESNQSPGEGAATTGPVAPLPTAAIPTETAPPQAPPFKPEPPGVMPIPTPPDMGTNRAGGPGVPGAPVLPLADFQSVAGNGPLPAPTPEMPAFDPDVVQAQAAGPPKPVMPPIPDPTKPVMPAVGPAPSGPKPVEPLPAMPDAPALPKPGEMTPPPPPKTEPMTIPFMPPPGGMALPPAGAPAPPPDTKPAPPGTPSLPEFKPAAPSLTETKPEPLPASPVLPSAFREQDQPAALQQPALKPVAPLPPATPAPDLPPKPATPARETVPADPTVRRAEYEVNLVSVRRGDSYDAIAKDSLGDSKYGDLLRRYNNDRELRPGEVVKVPPAPVLRKLAGPNWTGAPDAPKPAAPRTYTTARDGMSMWDIAYEVYGTKAEFRKVIDANRDRNPNLRYRAGERFRLPGQ